MKRKLIKILAPVLLLALLGAPVSLAAESGTVYSAKTQADDLVMYIENPGEYSQIECQIGTQMCETVTASPLTEEAVPLETIFLIDNSLSVTEEYRPAISDILTQLAANRMDGEIFTVAVFSTEIQYLLEDSNDYTQVKAAIDSITYQDQETYLTDVLYELLEELRASDDSRLTRIVIVSDGVDNKEIGYTKEELYSLLNNHICPIYTLGCTYNGNSEELENMFSLSRRTGGESWLLDDVSDNMEVVSGIAALNDALKVTITPKAEDCDGTTKGISLTLTGAEQVQYSVEMQMPFAQNSKAAEEEDTAADVPAENTETLADTSSPETNESAETLNPVIKTSEGLPIPLIAGGAALVLILVIVCVILLKKKGKKDEFQPAPDSIITGTAGRQPSGSSSGAGAADSGQKPNPTRATHMVSKEQSGTGDKERRTLYVWGKKVYLTDVNDPRQEFSASLQSGEILAGWDSDCQICIRYNDTVSGKHLSIREKNGAVVVKNLSRTNPLAVNGKTAEGEVELHTGDVLTLGEINMRVRIEG